MRRVSPIAVLFVALLAGVAAPVGPVAANAPVPQSFPSDFPVPTDASLGVPVIGFGAKGPISRTPVIFLHGNNDTSHPTTCNGGFGNIYRMAQYFHDNGYTLSELWGLSYQGEQCDLSIPGTRSAVPHTAKANVPDLRAFANAVLAYTGAKQVDLVGHSLGVSLSREWMRQDNAYGIVRSLVAVDGPEHGIINCSPNPLNYYQAPGFSFTPDSPVCLEFGSDHTPLLTTLNSGDETPGPTRYMAIRNADTSFVYFSKQDGSFPAVPAEDREGNPHDFSMSAQLQGATNVDVTGQGQYDNILLTAHLGIINSSQTWKLAFDFLAQITTVSPASPVGGPGRLAASGQSGGLRFLGIMLLGMGLLMIARLGARSSRRWGS